MACLSQYIVDPFSSDVNHQSRGSEGAVPPMRVGYGQSGLGGNLGFRV